MEKSRFILTEDIRKTLSLFEKLVVLHGYTVAFKAEGDAWVYADQVKIGQVVYNLINNAISFTGEEKKSDKSSWDLYGTITEPRLPTVDT